MFTKLLKGRGVVSDEGYCVERIGSPLTQFFVRYLESDHVLEYPLENVTSDSVNRISVAKIGPWFPPYQSEALDVYRKIQIASRIREAMQFLGDAIEIY